jgi:signal transduction histidine kinase
VSTIPTKQDFATEVRSDRLAILWKVTLVACVIFFWLLFTVTTIQKIEGAVWLGGLIVLTLGCLATRWLLMRDRFTAAVWAYALSGVLAATLIIAMGDPRAKQILPFIFPLIVFVIGLLLPPSSTLILAGLAALAVILGSIPNQIPGEPIWSSHQLFAIALTFISALLAAQVTGELYQVTEWALLNYQRERKTTGALFDSRQQLERALVRSQALSEELQTANSELEKARAAAEDAKKFRGQFLANMSHELRTPLNAIIGFSETMLKFPQMYDSVTLPKAYEGDLSQIYSSGRQLLHLINDILDLSKVDAGKLEIHMRRCDLRPILDGVLATAQGLIGDRPIELTKDLPEVLPLVWADDARVRQVLINLYSNAIKFTDSGSILLTVRDTDEGVRISVKDTGSGIDPKNHQIIFEEFKQAETIGRDPRAGAGLGLAIARQLLDLMDGRIWVESELGKGATFHFVLYPYRTRDSSRPRRPTDEIKRTEAEVEQVLESPSRQETKEEKVT